jgi:hypothetical protein
VIDMADRLRIRSLQIHVAKRMWRLHARIGRKEATATLSQS